MLTALPFGTQPIIAPGSKGDMYVSYYAGEFGNQLVTWPTLDSYLASGYQEPVCIRYREKNSPWCVLGIERACVVDQVNKWVGEGAKRELFTVNELGPDEQLTLQGEIRRSTKHLYLCYSTVPKPMRRALEEHTQHAEGMRAEAILQHYLDDKDYEFLIELLEKYQSSCDVLDDPLHNVVIEFSVWRCKVGTWNRRMVVWEIRRGY